MRNGTIDADRGYAKPKVDGLKTCRAKICGAMAQQRRADGRNENDSAPQKLVHLVGCRDPNARKAPWIRPRPKP